MNDWRIYRGDRKVREIELPEPPPWRVFSDDGSSNSSSNHAGATFQASREVVDAVNAALMLRRPLLVTGIPGSGKSSLIDAVALELSLGPVLRWHVTSRSTLNEALYRYDAIGRLQAERIAHDEGATKTTTSISDYLTLGPLGTALIPRSKPRALLVDEIDKSDIDLPNDLLNVFERGEFEIPELTRHKEDAVDVREFESQKWVRIHKGKVQCAEFPFVVLTSNGERDFPTAFLRRCIRLRMPDTTKELLEDIVSAHLRLPNTPAVSRLIDDFLARTDGGKPQATDQLLNAVYLVTQNVLPEDSTERQAILELLFRELTSEF
ncbi:MoxR family ATPase [Agromyces sp. SYSU K20354]|uniref:AAA family ATPase n=1 Tax=Agromyces cavernae TaxID=2898659 RepID=UPI001E3D6C4D|nr:MoxR family ATPase [Agromyces cavernae]MCD2441866.1 MoxR family ATPase [Agromyces cavernae]